MTPAVKYGQVIEYIPGKLLPTVTSPLMVARWVWAVGPGIITTYAADRLNGFQKHP